MIEDIVGMLAIVGIPITFEAVGLIPAFPIQAIPGFNLTKFYGGEGTVYTPEVQSFEFQLATVDQKAHSIIKGMYFTMSDGVYTHRFKLDGRPVPDLTGWTRITVNWVSMI
jgi:hypothetical protein